METFRVYLSHWPEVHREDRAHITDVAEQVQRKQLPTNLMESSPSTLQLFGGTQSWPQ